jgi:thiamine-phosphate pyrophosphorylase
MSFMLRGFYGIVDAPASPAAAVALAERLLSGGACALQLRMKRAATADLVACARALRAVVHGVPFVVNDRIDVALLVGADAVHLGQDDLTLADARALAGGRPLVVGVSTHDLAQVAAAVAAGADYLGFGPVFATASKENPDPVQGLGGLAAAVRAASATPVVAIGGITVERAAAVAATGAAAACAILAVNAAPDPSAAARAITRAFAS